MNKQGFTLLEVSLFFAVSGLLALVAFAGLAPRLRNVRFTDAVRTLESTTQRQLSDFQSGVNLRTGDFRCSQSGTIPSVTTALPGQEAGTAADCIINGRLAVFEENQVVFYPIISLRKPNGQCTDSPSYGKIFCHSPQIMAYDATRKVSEYRNGATRIAPESNQAIAYIQDPQGTQTKLLHYTSTLPIGSGEVRPLLEGDVNLEPASLCLGLSGRTAQITYASNNLKPDVQFEGCTI